jgi:hypothetical protein
LCSDRVPSQQETTEYVAEMLLAMKELTSRHDLSTLEVLLTLAHREADLRAKDGR